MLGDCYAKGLGVRKNIKEAVKLYSMSADKGMQYMQCNGCMCVAYKAG